MPSLKIKIRLVELENYANSLSNIKCIYIDDKHSIELALNFIQQYDKLFLFNYSRVGCLLNLASFVLEDDSKKYDDFIKRIIAFEERIKKTKD